LHHVWNGVTLIALTGCSHACNISSAPKQPETASSFPTKREKTRAACSRCPSETLRVAALRRPRTQVGFGLGFSVVNPKRKKRGRFRRWVSIHFFQNQSVALSVFKFPHGGEHRGTEKKVPRTDGPSTF